MDAFEQLVSEVLSSQGYWTQTSVKVNLTKEEKRNIGRPSSPRWELDVVAYSGKTNTLLVIECKSYLDSLGVSLKPLLVHSEKEIRESRYKLFVDDKLREVVLSRLASQMVDNGSCRKGVKAKLGLACGKISKNTDRNEITSYFKEKNWCLFDEKWIRDGLSNMSDGSYENQVSSVVSKMLLRVE